MKTAWHVQLSSSELLHFPGYTNQRAEMGDQIGFKFLGQKKNYNDYVVLVEKNGHAG